MVKLDEFQTLYILTCQMVYGKIRLLGKAPEDAQKFLADFYVKVYEGSGFIPAEEERHCTLLAEWLEHDIETRNKKGPSQGRPSVCSGA